MIDDKENSNLYKTFISDWKSSDIMGIETSTSGSTGTPKIILIPKSVMRESARRTIRYFGIDKGWILQSCISAKYIGGKMMTVRAMESGADFICSTPSNRPELSEVINSDRPVLVAIVPSQMWHILTLDLDLSAKKRICFLIGGSSIPEELKNEIVKNKINAVETYGMTETSSHIALRRISDNDESFVPLPGITLSLSDKGTLVIENVIDRPIYTNDLVEFDSSGSFRILGRLDNVIITGGLKIIPEVLEQKLYKILSDSPFDNLIDNLMVTSEPDSKWSESLILVVESHELNCALNSNGGGLTDKIRKFLKVQPADKLQPHEVPKRIIITGHLPKTSNGKLIRKKFGCIKKML